jgi:FkbM family methyltransferase
LNKSFIFKKIPRSFQVIGLYRNWPLVFLCYFRIIRHSKIIYVLRDGCKLTGGINGYAAMAVIHEIWLTEAYAKRKGDIKKGFTIIDVGANIGSFTIFASTRAEDVHLYSYEPLANNFDLLRENIKLNNLKTVKPFQLAVTGKGGKVKLYIDDKDICLNSIISSVVSPKTPYKEVDSVSLQQIFDDNGISECDLLKMDCEGAEYEIFYNTPVNILSRIKRIALEHHDLPDHHVGDLEKYLESKGFDTHLDKEHILYADRRS